MHKNLEQKLNAYLEALGKAIILTHSRQFVLNAPRLLSIDISMCWNNILATQAAMIYNCCVYAISSGLSSHGHLFLTFYLGFPGIRS